MSELGVTVGYICADVAARVSCEVSLDEEHTPLPQQEHDSNCYTFGKIGSHKVAICSPWDEVSCESSVADMMFSFPSIKLLVLVNSKAGAVPRAVGEVVRVGDVVIAQKLAKWDCNGDLVEMGLSQASGLPATADMITGRQWSLKEDIKELILNNKKWAKQCKRPIGEDIDKLDEIIGPRDEPDSVAYRDGLVISNNTYPENAISRDSIADPETFQSASVVCFDHGQTAGLQLRGQWLNVDAVSVLGVSNYCDEDSKKDRSKWKGYSSMAAAACARKIVRGLVTET
ncbi:hypothetical protein CkaCkLH20_11394 [Colletotrichum karsti]|uniref:Nucleoside phosphorylase domain-containing protein n=1 Tax=Colletotrichum karsti TaxID=1095194 RepID=A0A9P6I3F1_9PEZI|nr:uncharacterized protein CkaCkLH20_11394 [Colletotrichum karsti]KAF9871225.1 hypothetical protein CkaCkLH20_11394 [Colletotrichum karsti]